MKTFTFFVSFLLIVAVSQAQDYQISFTGSGQSFAIDSIQVENLTQGTTLTLHGDDVLHLVETLGINSVSDNKNTLKIYPNPMIESTMIEFFNSNSRLVSVEIYNEMGGLITKQSTSIQQGTERFEIRNLNSGVYTVIARSSDWKYTAKLISLGNNFGNTTIKYQSNDYGSVPKSTLKSTNNLVKMQYNNGERILFKGFSSNYARVLTLVPTQRQIVDFNFIPCFDFDGHYYAVVTIGTQTWMAENLKTTRYIDGIGIPLVTDLTAWVNLSTPAYCWYDNNQFPDGNTYGALYNWFTVKTGSLCPIGWHMPTDIEWTTLTDYLAGSGVAGGKLKETGTAHWTAPNNGATNETGFTALPGGSRFNGVFDDIGVYGRWWSISLYNTNTSWGRYIQYSGNSILSSNYGWKSGFSVRCVRD